MKPESQFNAYKLRSENIIEKTKFRSLMTLLTYTSSQTYTL